MRERKIGANGPAVSPLGLGCMGMSDFYGPADRAESTATIDAVPKGAGGGRALRRARHVLDSERGGTP